LNDSDLEPLVKLPKLDNLELDGCKITPACVKTLSQCKSLVQLSVRRNQWTPQQFATFKEAMQKTNPQIKIEEDMVDSASLKELAAPAPDEE